jgi:TolB-like protein
VGIDPASRWRSEISKAIEDCHCLVVLISNNSVSSHNVVKEVSLASEFKKPIIPIDLETVELTHDFRYPLAGIQHVPYQDFVKIRHAVDRIESERSASPFSPQAVYKSIKRRKDPLKAKVTLPVAGLVLLVFVYLLFFGRSKEIQVNSTKDIVALFPEKIKRAVVLPLPDEYGDKVDSELMKGLIEALNRSLFKLKDIQVIEKNASIKHKGSEENIFMIAADLGARYLFQVENEKYDDDHRIDIEVVDMNDNGILWKEIFSVTRTDDYHILDRIADTTTAAVQYLLKKEGNKEKPENYPANATGPKPLP